MKKATQASEAMQKIADMADAIRVAMVSAIDVGSHELTSRPMMALEIDDKASLWFFTKNATCLALALDRINVSFADTHNASYVSFAGRGAIVRDKAKIKALWSPMAKPWFPEGEDDPTLVLLRVDTESAEYWDSSSSKVVRLMAIAASAVAGEPIGMGTHKRITNPTVSA